MDNVQEMLVRALDGFGQRVHAVARSQWAGSTPCDLWSVRDLVNHMVWILRWTPPLIAGTSPAEVGTRFDGDLLGDDPVAAWADAEHATRQAAREADHDRKIATPYGELTVSEFLELVTAEALIHTWDLARSIGADETLDPGLVGEALGRYRTNRLYHGSAPGESWPALFDPPVAGPSDADPQSQLIRLVGRDPAPAAAG
ncbi:MAG TPA: TIGR03086 family metal-binding protein [Streptosporangiaceae bacterium]|jgi:uncharacterized protein (TIGR03086 family)|nr:TIGR03086 family metal-binding protein [Streptosporangiaceae bacterium]